MRAKPRDVDRRGGRVGCIVVSETSAQRHVSRGFARVARSYSRCYRAKCS